jgi:hypothetical protein
MKIETDLDLLVAMSFLLPDDANVGREVLVEMGQRGAKARVIRARLAARQRCYDDSLGWRFVSIEDPYGKAGIDLGVVSETKFGTEWVFVDGEPLRKVTWNS